MENTHWKLNSEQQQLVEENHNLIYGFLRDQNLDEEEYYDLLACGLCKAAYFFNSKKGAFSTLAYTCMEQELWKKRRHEYSQGYLPDDKILSYNAPIYSEGYKRESIHLDYFPSRENTEQDAITNVIIQSFRASFKERDQKIFDLFLLGYNAREISEMIGVSRSRIDQIRTKMQEKYLRRYKKEKSSQNGND